MWILLFIGIAIPLIVLAKSSKPDTKTNQDVYAENVYKEITYKPEKLAPFPVGTTQCTTCVIKTQSTPPITRKVEKLEQSMTELSARDWIISHEGGPTSVNPSSLACGMPQSLPCSKLLRFAGVDMTLYNLNTYDGVKAAISTVSPETQLAWMENYVLGRYKSFLGAYNFWLVHKWY